MHSYSELSKQQKAVIDGMRLGGKLYWLKVENKFCLSDARGFTVKVANVTGESLKLHGYIQEDYREMLNGRIKYKLTPDIK